MYTLRNKKININMITLGMAVMVESEDALWLSFNWSFYSSLDALVVYESLDYYLQVTLVLVSRIVLVYRLLLILV